MPKQLAKVCVDTGLMSLDKEFDYRIPAALEEDLQIGHMVEVPFGGSRKNGIVVGISDETSEYALKDIFRITNPEPVIGPTEIELAGYMQKMYVASFYDCLKLLCPPGILSKPDKRVFLRRDVPDEEVRRAVARSVNQERVVAFLEEAGGESTMEELRAQLGASARPSVLALEEKGILETERFVKRSTGSLFRDAVRLKEENPAAFSPVLEGRSVLQRQALLRLMKGSCPVSDCIKEAPCSHEALRALEKKGLVERYKTRVRRSPFSNKEVTPTQKKEPTSEQRRVLKTLFDAYAKGTGETFLLHGVTGSGKTEVFMQLIEQVLSSGKTAIVLVPEISLTPQMTDRFLGRFGDCLAILHSVLSQGERQDEWHRIKSGEARVVIGARSAVFAPLSDIGVIIVDEEHENTYKSEQSPRYDALEIAKKRCRQYGAMLLLASATPDVADFYKAQTGRYHLLQMKKRYNRVPLPDVYIADMRRELLEGNRSMLSRLLQREIAANLASGEQTVLFLNRRGFSTFVSCRDCGFVAQCPSCSIALTYHKTTETLNCHYCGYRQHVMTKCPDCGGSHVRYFGTGTQRLEEEIQKLFPACSLIRMDVDTTSKKGAHERILKKFAEEKIDILLGTQMVAKGLDFPGISLVGVVAADLSLNIDDYRASERTFDLITQVCGRAGRAGKVGRAVIQTYTPDNAVIQYAKAQDYEAFYENEIRYRRMFSYPPFQDIVCVNVSSKEEALAREICQKAEARFESLTAGDTGVTKYPSGAAPLSRIKGLYRWRFWFKAKADMAMREKLRTLYLEQKNAEVRMTVEINPNSMF